MVTGPFGAVPQMLLCLETVLIKQTKYVAPYKCILPPSFKTWLQACLVDELGKHALLGSVGCPSHRIRCACVCYIIAIEFCQIFDFGSKMRNQFVVKLQSTEKYVQ